MKVKIGLLFFLFLGSFLTQAQLRIVSLAPSITENIYSLKGSDMMVGCTDFCKIAVSDEVDIIGSAIDVNVEKILSLKPDLVLTMELTSKRDIETLKKLGVKVVVISTPRNFREICDQTFQIARLIGRSKEAEVLIARATKRTDEIRTILSADAEIRKIFFQLGANPIFTVLENTFMNDFITYCNGENIAAGMSHGTITRETILVKNPDVIMIATMGGFGEKEKQVWEQYKHMEAVKNGNVFLVQSETSCSPTPMNFVLALEEIKNKLKK